LDDNIAYGYDNASAGVSGAAVYTGSSSTDPAYTVLTDPCAENYTDTLCSEYATCVSNTSAFAYVYQCQCNSGFNDTTSTDATTPATSPSTLTQSGLVCSDVVQCSDPVATCGAGVDQCTDGLGTYTCNCTTGYTLNSNFCNDDDECTLNTDTCDANATCANTAGSYNCTCDTGYSGDGFNCTDIDECALNTDTCSSDATCTNTDGSYTCACNTGYTGDGFSCTNIDECALNTDTCSSDATCTDTTGSYTCACNAGYSGDGFNCTDIDECTDGSATCIANADCTNTDGSYTCTCSAGYTGDGLTNCTDIDECANSTDNNCNANAQCANTEGSFTCACNSGYIGDGTTTCIVATPIDYCYRAVIEVNSTATISDANTEQAWTDFLTFYKNQDSTFYYADVTFTHDLQQGASPVEVVASACFTNMTKTASELTNNFMLNYDSSAHGVTYDLIPAEIRDFDECVNSFDSNCYDFNSVAGETAFYSAVCSNTDGAYDCACNASLYDVNGNGTLCQDPYTYTCNGTYSTLTLYSDWFNGIGGNNWNVTFMTTNSTSCSGQLSADSTSYVFTDCNTTTWQDDTTIYAPVRVQTDTSGLQYITTSLIDFTYQCTQEIGQNVTVGFGSENDTANAVQDNVVDINDIFAPGSTTAVDIAIAQYVTNFETSNQLVSGSTVNTGDMACLQLDVTNAAGVDVQYVTVSTKAPGSATSLTILENGCPTAEATNFGITVETYPGGQMCFTMHRPSDSYALEVDMSVNVCVDTCTQVTCSTRRRRRRAAEGDSRLETGLETVFKIDPADQCSRNCGDGACMLDFDSTQKCVCNTGAAKVDDGTCKALTVDENGNVETITTTTSDNSTLYIIVGVAIGVLIFVVILAGFFCYRRRQFNDQKQSHDNYGYKN